MNLLVSFINLVCFVTMVQSFDLGPLLRIAHCRIQCIKEHSIDGTCDWYSNRSETLCSECWQNCETLETQWDTTKFICEGEEYLRCPACQTACKYRKTRTEEEYLPSSLPAPSRGPVRASANEVAIFLRQVGPSDVNGGWKESGFFSGNRIPSLRQDTWLIVVSEETIRHYSWQEWTPTLESLKEGPFVEASLSWFDVNEQLRKQRDVEQKRFNDRVRQFYLEKYGEKVLVEWRSSQDTPIPEKVFRRFFFRRRSDEYTQPPSLEHQVRQSQSYNGDDDNDNQETYVVSWMPETGGLMGNQVVDTKFAQISLLPGTKYLIRIASNDGPGSFPIEIDTRSSSIDVWKVKKKNDKDLLPWAFLAAIVAALVIIVVIAGVKIFRLSRAPKIIPEEEIV
ncbi:hypothetical protein G9C98_008028 [Cotesia typhae]|uniref:Fibronectin type-III domain-containing protein n=1 Tax=Cotesia typhae TaxID=2053667 RepID=A0A8J5UPD9_9HYME|nr:hypothetical protein G9C98_008028 [Cotesia typhae]